MPGYSPSMHANSTVQFLALSSHRLQAAALLTMPSLDPAGYFEPPAPGLLHAIKFNKVVQRIRWCSTARRICKLPLSDALLLRRRRRRRCCCAINESALAAAGERRIGGRRPYVGVASGAHGWLIYTIQLHNEHHMPSRPHRCAKWCTGRKSLELIERLSK